MPSSICWKFFSLQADKTTAVCRICSHKLTYSHRSTSNMNRHLNVKHPIQLAAEKEKSLPTPVAKFDFSPEPSTSTASSVFTEPVTKQQTVQECVERSQKYKPDSLKKKTIDKLVINMIVEDTRPLSAVEDKGFRKLIDYLDPRYQMIARSTVGKHLPEMYEKKKEELKNEMSDALSVSITTDH